MLADELGVDVVHHHQLHLVLVDLFLRSYTNPQHQTINHSLSTMLHGSETWAPNASDLQRLCRNDRAMIRWICGAKLADKIPTAVALLQCCLCFTRNWI